jgi:hypothetical protein
VTFRCGSGTICVPLGFDRFKISQTHRDSIKALKRSKPAMMNPRVRWVSVLLYTVYWFALSIIDVPNVAIVERAICIQKYDDPFIDEAACKRSDVQSALANTVGWKLTFNSLAGECF